MTAPRQVLEGSTYLVTRRCSERRFFLRPSRKTLAIFQYVLAAIAERYGVLIHAFCVLSNHYHLVITDPAARLPEFHRDLDALIARAVNFSLGRTEAFWDSDSYSAVKLEGPAAIVEKMVYVLANPVAAGLVRRGTDWPGLWSDPKLLGHDVLNIERPTEFFRANGPLPAIARLQLVPPPGFDAAELATTLTRLLAEVEDRTARELAAEGRSFLGAGRVLAQSAHARPTTREPWRALNPTVACRNKWRRVETILRLKEFCCAYRDALQAWRAGVRDVVFPPGTWLMRVLHRVRCAAAAG